MTVKPRIDRGKRFDSLIQLASDAKPGDWWLGARSTLFIKLPGHGAALFPLKDDCCIEYADNGRHDWNGNPFSPTLVGNLERRNEAGDLLWAGTFVDGCLTTTFLKEDSSE